MPINKVTYNNTTLIDLSSDTVAADKLLSGYSAHDSAGNIINGTLASGSPAVGSLIVCSCTTDITSVIARYGSATAGAYMSNNVAYVIIPYTYTGVVYVDGYAGSVVMVTNQVTISGVDKYTCVLSTGSVIYNNGVWCDELSTHTWSWNTASSDDCVTENSSSITATWYYNSYSYTYATWSGAVINNSIPRRNYTKLRYTYSNMGSSGYAAFGYVNSLSSTNPYPYIASSGNSTTGDNVISYTGFSSYTKRGDSGFDETNKTVTVDLNSGDNVIYLNFVTYNTTITKIEFV